MLLSFINILKVLGRLKTEGEALGFQHFPQALENVNEWKIMFDPSIGTQTGSFFKQSRDFALSGLIYVGIYLCSDLDYHRREIKICINTTKTTKRPAHKFPNLETIQSD